MYEQSLYHDSKYCRSKKRSHPLPKHTDGYVLVAALQAEQNCVTRSFIDSSSRSGGIAVDPCIGPVALSRGQSRSSPLLRRTIAPTQNGPLFVLNIRKIPCTRSRSPSCQAVKVSIWSPCICAIGCTTAHSCSLHCTSLAAVGGRSSISYFIDTSS